MTTAVAEPSVREWSPGPRQIEALQAMASIEEEHYGFIGYGGAAGGGKTNLLAEAAIEVAISCPGSSSLIGRNAMVDLKTTTLAEFDRRLPPELLKRKYDSSPVFREIRHPSWPAGVFSTVHFRQVADAMNKLGSGEWGWAFIEEGHECDKSDLLYLFSRLRHRPEKKRGIMVGFNPFPSFVTDVFMEGTVDLFKAAPELADVLRVKFIPALVTDNPHLPPNYAEMMRVAYSNDPFYLSVLLEGKAGVVPKAVYGQWLNNPTWFAAMHQVDEQPKDIRFVSGHTGWDWGTSESHKAAGAFGLVSSTGELWTWDSWESAMGSSNELISVAEGWATVCDRMGIPCSANYDASQGSLADPLSQVFGSGAVNKGVRDVEGRIRVGRGLHQTGRAKYAWWRPGAREVVRYLRLYHRDDDDAIVEVKDDIPDAWHYMAYEAEYPTAVHAGKGAVLNWELD